MFLFVDCFICMFLFSFFLFSTLSSLMSSRLLPLVCLGHSVSAYTVDFYPVPSAVCMLFYTALSIGRVQRRLQMIACFFILFAHSVFSLLHSLRSCSHYFFSSILTRCLSSFLCHVL